MGLSTKAIFNEESKVTGYDISIRERFDRLVTCKEGTYIEGEWVEAPEYKTTKEETREIYAQKVESIDLTAVILAINGITKEGK